MPAEAVQEAVLPAIPKRSNLNPVDYIASNIETVNPPAFPSLLAGKDKLKRKKMMHQAHVKYGYTLKEIADYLGIHYTTVSKVIKGIGYKK